METKIFCFQDSVCLKDTIDATISDELQISFIYSPNMIMTVIKIIITIKLQKSGKNKILLFQLMWKKKTKKGTKLNQFSSFLKAFDHEGKAHFTL